MPLFLRAAETGRRCVLMTYFPFWFLNQLLKNDFHNLYAEFDCFIDCVEQNKKFFNSLNIIEQIFLSVEQLNSRYCSAPPSYRNSQEHPNKREAQKNNISQNDDIGENSGRAYFLLKH